jgi:ornithine cyclodeaminase
MLLLSEEQVMQSISIPDAIAAVREAAVALFAPSTVVPLRHRFPIDDGHGNMLVMPAYAPRVGAAGHKTIIGLHERPGRPRNSHSVILLFRLENGEPFALLRSSRLTDLRTGASAAVATDVLARPDASVLGVIGAGRVAQACVEAICAVRPIQSVLIHSRTPSRVEECIARLTTSLASRPEGAPTMVARAMPESVVGEADVVVTATTAQSPVVLNRWVRPGTHLNGMGAANAQAQEVDEELVVRADCLAVEERTAAAVPGDLGIPLKKGLIQSEQLIEVGRILAGEAPGRQRSEDVTFFKSTGIAIQDLAVAARVVERALARGIGTHCPFNPE